MNTNERLRVLYAEDDGDSFDMLQVMLGLFQIDVERATTLGEALTRAGAERFDLYLLDSGLPDGSGVNLCRTLRAVDPTVPVLFFSGSAHPEEIELGMAAGAGGYIAKPHSDKLAETILQLVGNQRQTPIAFASLPAMAAAA